MLKNNWKISWLPPFKDRFYGLVAHIKDLKEKDPIGYKTHPDTKLLKSIVNVIEDIADNPFHKKFNLGKTLGKKYTHWRRAKNSLPKRYRLFFRADTKLKIIILCWINDDNTLRKSGDKNDVYIVFKQMLIEETIPDDMDQLIKRAENPPESHE
ncbi:MAG: type II toxin-antitoxin system YhaV family toxin [Desulfobacteraceae bacterium]|nr:type II toxin-antitoxin system YhaV family toxin [Pseudomonadota bacterium]MCG2752394.1 type II toxin-antitoxin system YhaV family toxin [Desulfobacteraceae bacterium]